MKYNSATHHRQSIRLRAYDYRSTGGYFVTICTYGRECMLSAIGGEGISISSVGLVVQACWDDLVNHYEHVALDAFVVMPNHVHGVIWLRHDVGAGLRPAPTRLFGGFADGLPEIIRAFKSFSSRRINEIRGTPGSSVWQRNYYERVIRNEREPQAIRQYIRDNPAKWAEDPNNPERA